MTAEPRHAWRFYRAGGLDQVRLETGADIAHLAQLDPKLWVALACPVKGLEFDHTTLALLDTDHDGRVRVPEILGAVRFLRERLQTLDGLVAGADEMPLDALSTQTAEGQSALASAKRILANLGKADAGSIAFADIADPTRIFEGTRFNGDGVVTVASADDEATGAVIRDILATHGGVPDRSGAQGVDLPRVEAFFHEAATLTAWAASGEQTSALPLGAGTAAALAAVQTVRAKIDDYFARCRLAAFDPRALAALNRAESDYLAIAAANLSIDAQEVAGFPLARVEPGRALPLSGAVNPAWSAALETLRSAALAPLPGARDSLSEAQWRELNARLAPYEAWNTARPATNLLSLGLERVRTILASGAEARIRDLLERDLALASESAGIDAVGKLVRLQRDFVRLLHNFVSFGDFYSRQYPALFQAGRLYLDSRECQLCVRVENVGRHAAIAGLSKCYLAYCDLTRCAGAERMAVLAVFTQGDSDFLMVGRNGLFIDRQGQDWDATITRIVDAPISIRQAFSAPYKKFVRLFEEQVVKRGSAAHVDRAAPPAEAPSPKKLDLGTIALIGTAISGIAAMVGLVLAKFFGLGLYMPLGLLALVVLISGPSMLIAGLKLRQRNLGPILDANGWAINGRVKVNIPFGSALTHEGRLPPGSQLTLDDPFAEKPNRWPRILALLALGAALVYFARRYFG